jgi:hypothetical protein
MRDTEFFFWVFILPCGGAGIDADLADFVLVELVAHLRLPKLASECDFKPFEPSRLQWKGAGLGLALGSDVTGSHQERDLSSLYVLEKDFDGKGVGLNG